MKLVETIRKIEASFEYSTREDRDLVIRLVYEQLAKSNSVVGARLAGETTFEEQYSQLLGDGVFFPYAPPDSVGRLRRLEFCIGESPLKDSYSAALVENPVGMAAVFALGGAVFSAASSVLAPSVAQGPSSAAEKGVMGRREFFSDLVATGIAFSILGAVGGGALSYQYDKRLNRMRENATYLDQVYERVFPNTTAHSERPPLVANYFRRFDIASNSRT